LNPQDGDMEAFKRRRATELKNGPWALGVQLRLDMGAMGYRKISP
jgi:hypothetical protein